MICVCVYECIRRVTLAVCVSEWLEQSAVMRPAYVARARNVHTESIDIRLYCCSAFAIVGAVGAALPPNTGAFEQFPHMQPQ